MKKDQHGCALQRKSQRGQWATAKKENDFPAPWAAAEWPLEPSAIISGRYCISYRAIADFLLFFFRSLPTWGNFSRSWVKRAKKNKERWISWGGKVVKIYYFKCFFSVESLWEGERGEKLAKRLFQLLLLLWWSKKWLTGVVSVFKWDKVAPKDIEPSRKTLGASTTLREVVTGRERWKVRKFFPSRAYCRK